MRTLCIALLLININCFSEEKLINIPFVTNKPILDGNLSEWSDNWHDILNSSETSITNALYAKFAAVWTSDTIYFAYWVTDTTPFNGTYSFWNDCIEIKPSMDSTKKWLEKEIFYRIERNSSKVKSWDSENVSKIRAYVKNTNKQYIVECAIPFDVINGYLYKPHEGSKIAFNTTVSDNIGDTLIGARGRTQKIFWYDWEFNPDGSLNCGYLKLVSNGVSVPKISEKKYPNVYINSFNEIVFDKQYTNIILYDYTGRFVIRTGNIDRLSIANLPKGVYILNLNQADMVKVLKE